MVERNSERQYKNNITAVKSKISEIERANLDLDHLKKVAELSYEDWVKWQNKELEV